MPTVDRRRSLFQPAEKRVVTNANEWQAKLYDGLKDAVPDSSFLQNAEHMEEIYRPLSVPSVSDV